MAPMSTIRCLMKGDIPRISSFQEVRRIADKLARRRIQPAHIIAWSCWRRAHQASARRTHIKSKMQLEC
ncbi:MAG: hypothetical protein CMH85_09555 [Novosphingobium sp.]|nr:hypothetical protein [Novosphingobium sp.]